MAIELLEELREQLSGTQARRERRERDQTRASTEKTAEQVAKGLGWFSIGLGTAEVVMPDRMASLTGVRNHPDLFRTYGLRELGAGMGILTQRRSAGWIWARVAGDALDLASLGFAMTTKRADRHRLAYTTAAVAGVTALDIACALRLSRGAPRHVHTFNSIIVNRSPEDLYSFWRDFRNVPRFMRFVRDVRIIDSRRSHWIAEGPGGRTIEWDSEVINEEPNRAISWHSVANSRVENFGTVRFERAPGGRGTLVKMEMHHRAPAGFAGAAVTRLFGKIPERIIHEDLRRFKQLVETGEVVSNEGPSGPRTGALSQLAKTMHI